MTRITAILSGIIFLAAPLLAAGQAAAQTCVEPPAGMLNWWPGDGNGDDVQSNMKASLAGGAGYASGLVGEAFNLDVAGQVDLVYLPAASANGLVDMTVELWVNSTDPGQGGILSGASASSGDNEFLLFQQQSPSELMVFLKRESSGWISVAINDGQWHHVAFTRQGTMGRVYVDGVMVASMSTPMGPLDIGPGGLILGQEQDCLGGCFDSTQAFEGLIDEVTIYGRALSDDEIWQIFAAGGDGKCKPPVPPSLDLDELMARIMYLESDADSLSQRVADLEAQLADQAFLMEEMQDGMGVTQDLEVFEKYLYETYHLKCRGGHKDMCKYKHKGKHEGKHKNHLE